MIDHRTTQSSPLRRAPLVGCLLSACLGVGVASFTGCNQVYNQLGPFGGVARTLVDNYFGLKLNFSIAGAPENNVEQVFFYLSRTSDIATHLHEESITLLEEFAVLFEIEANAKTAEGLAAIAGSARKVDPATMSHPQKEWLASNIDDLVGVGFGIARLADCAGSFVGAISAAADDVEQNPAIVLGYFDSIGDALDDANRLLDAAPGLSNAVEIISTVVELGKAEGIEPPSKVQARLLADKAATSAIGEEVTFS